MSSQHDDQPQDSSLQSQFQSLREGAGFFVHQKAEHIYLAGEDRFRFLNGQVTCDVGSLQPGDGTYGFFTTAKGRIEADVEVVAEPDGLLLRVPPGKGEDLLARLRKYIIVDRVEPELVERRVLSLVGPRAADIWQTSAAEFPTAQAHGRPDGWTLWTRLDDGPAAVASLKAAGAVEVGAEAWERYRIESGRPLFARDFGPDFFPQETGIEDAVCYTKGCYLGQEVVARIHYRGGVQRRLRRILITSNQEPEALEQAQLRLAPEDTKGVGRLTSVARCDDRLLGLSIVHIKATVGSTVALMDAAGRQLGQGQIEEAG